MRRLPPAGLPDPGPGTEGSRLVWQALAQHLARLRSVVAKLHAGGPADVHDARVAARRLRSLLAIYRPLFDQRRSRRLRRGLRNLARVLSEPREADVRRDLLLAAASRLPAAAAADSRRLQATLRRDCATSRRAMREALGSADLAESVEIIGDEGTLSALRLRPDVELAELLELVDAPWRDADRLLADGPGSLAALHRLRLALKRCRYALESVSSLQARGAGQAIDRLRSAQDSLGEHLDAAAARKWLRANEATLGRPFVRSLDHELKAYGRGLESEALRRAADVMPAYARWRMALHGLRTPKQKTRRPA